MTPTERIELIRLDSESPITEFRGEYRWLSNFYSVQIEFEGEQYPTVEHAYQAAKTLDLKARERIRETCFSPGAAKREGRMVMLRPNWDKIKQSVMLSLLRDKFRRGPLREKLISTHGRFLSEGNWWGDYYWGVCRGVGMNHLGRLLMQVRNELCSETN